MLPSAVESKSAGFQCIIMVVQTQSKTNATGCVGSQQEDNTNRVACRNILSQ